MPSRYALVTAADDSFVEAAEVMLFSFARRNPWFDGETVVIDCGLSDEGRRRIGNIRPARFISPDPRLREATRALASCAARTGAARPRFDKLEMFRLTGFDRLVFLDADILVTGDFRELFETEIRLGACLERTTLLGHFRGTATYKTYRSRAEACEPLIGREFNTGVLTVRGDLPGEPLFAELVALLDPARWAEVVVPELADQIVFNWRLSEETTPLSARYNFMPLLESALLLQQDLSWQRACAHHYTCAFKPWRVADPEQLARRAPELLKYWEIWQAEAQRARERDVGGPDWEAERVAHDRICRAVYRGEAPDRWRADWRFNRSGDWGVIPPEFMAFDTATGRRADG